MTKLQKIILFIVSLVGLLFSAAMLSLFYYIPAVTDAVRFAYDFFPLLHNALAVYILFVSVCFFLLVLAALFAPRVSKYLIVVKNGGRLQFSRQTVESTVRYSFSDVAGVNLSAVKAMLGRTPEKTRIFVKLSLTDPSSLVELTETIKNKIEAALQTSLGITAQSINIKVVELASDEKPQQEGLAKTDDSAADSRVV